MGVQTFLGLPDLKDPHATRVGTISAEGVLHAAVLASRLFNRPLATIKKSLTIVWIEIYVTSDDHHFIPPFHARCAARHAYVIGFIAPTPSRRTYFPRVPISRQFCATLCGSGAVCRHQESGACMSTAPVAPHPLATIIVNADDEVNPDPYSETPSGGSITQKIMVSAVVIGPFIGLVTAFTVAWNTVAQPVNLVTAAIFYVFSGLGVTVGFHRLLTHRSFLAKRWLRIALAIAGSFALEGSATSWVALHRRHHVYSDREGDPHSPNLSGTGPSKMLKGFIHAHAGWLYTGEEADPARWAPDLLVDSDIRIVSALAPLWAILTFALPALIGFAATGTLAGMFDCLLWAGLVRIFLLHHITWSTNSVCHMFGSRPFTTKDLSRNFAPFAILSFGEAWHNGHHAFPSSARHGLIPGQIDISAKVISIFERLGLASNIRTPDGDRLQSRRNAN